jgi:hypothetical protein
MQWVDFSDEISALADRPELFRLRAETILEAVRRARELEPVATAPSGLTTGLLRWAIKTRGKNRGFADDHTVGREALGVMRENLLAFLHRPRRRVGA